MNRIGLIISGNLTGFSRFFATTEGLEMAGEAKIDFDYRNYLSFLNNDEKAYAISFSQRVTTVSLITRILDSFRRPGILVITALVNRNDRVDIANGQTDKYALFRLLNEVNNTFYEKNFVNGMLNQNPAVLMQDYYTPILEKYEVSRETQQRGVNATLEPAPLNSQRIGYVAAADGDVAEYLSSLYRKNYDGYHHVFLAANAQATIDEPPVEMLLYQVVFNNRPEVRIPPVKLNERIYNLRPAEGEMDIPKDYTYQQVLNGEAKAITADISGETLHISYRFGKEGRTVRFAFMENGKEVPFSSIAPITSTNRMGQKVNVNTNPFKFEGKEIYDGPHTIAISSDHYAIRRGCETIQVQSLSESAEVVIPLDRVNFFNIDFGPFRRPKRITLVNRKTGESILCGTNITDKANLRFPGNRSDWDCVIESNYYEKETFTIPNEYERRVISLRTKTLPDPNTTLVPTRQIHIPNDKEVPVSPKPPFPFKKIGLGVLAGLLLVAIVYGVYHFLNQPKENPVTPTPDEARFSIAYPDKSLITADDFQSFKDVLQVVVKNHEKEMSDDKDDNGFYVCKVQYDKDVDNVIEAEVFVVFDDWNKVSVSKISKDMFNQDDNEVICLNMSVTKSDLELAKQLKSLSLTGTSVSSKEKKELKTKVDKCSSDIKLKLNSLLSMIKTSNDNNMDYFGQNPSGNNFESRKAEEAKKRKAEEAKKKEEEAEKKKAKEAKKNAADNNNGNNSGVKNSGGKRDTDIGGVTDDKLPPNIIILIKGRGKIGGSIIRGISNKKHRDILTNYNKWRNKKENEDKEITSETYTQLENAIK